MRILLCPAWALAALLAAAPPAAAGGEKTMAQLLAEGFEFRLALEGHVVLQRTSAGLVGGGEAPAYLCPSDPARLLASLREAVCEPLHRS